MKNYNASIAKYIVEWIGIPIRVGLFFLLWNQFVPVIGKKFDNKRDFYSLVVVLILSESVLWYIGIDYFPFWIVGLSGIVLIYVILRKRVYIKETIFSILLYINFRYLAYFIVNTVLSIVTKKVMNGIELVENMNSFIHIRITILYNLTFILYAVILALEIFPIKKVIRKYETMSWNECGYLSILNIAGIILTRIMMELAVVDTGSEKFILLEEKPKLLLQMPVIAILLYLGEIAAIFIWQQYNYQRQRSEMYFVEHMEKEAIHQRLIDTEKYYDQIRKVRHEMASHMTNIKGLAEQGKQKELSQYITNLDESIRSIDMKIITGNPVTDVVINDRLQKAAEKGIVCSVSFAYDDSWQIPVYDISIILSNILDNAIKAAYGAKDELRFVNLKTTDRRNVLLIQCENGYGMEIREDKHYDEKWHGIGLKNVEEIADRFDGVVNIKKDEKIYSITVMLKKK